MLLIPKTNPPPPSPFPLLHLIPTVPERPPSLLLLLVSCSPSLHLVLQRGRQQGRTHITQDTTHEWAHSHQEGCSCHWDVRRGEQEQRQLVRVFAGRAHFPSPAAFCVDSLLPCSLFLVGECWHTVTRVPPVSFPCVFGPLQKRTSCTRCIYSVTLSTCRALLLLPMYSFTVQSLPSLGLMP